MQDFIPKGTGNSRFLKSSIAANSTFEQFLTMFRNGTLPFDFNGVNSEGVAQIGTPLNTANILPADVLEALNLPSSAVPKDAFKKLGDERDQIGDIKISTRTDLGENWLLCNGDVVDTTLYPGLASVPIDPTSSDFWKTEVFDNTKDYSNFIYANGSWYFACVNTGSNTSIDLIKCDYIGSENQITTTIYTDSVAIRNITQFEILNGSYVIVFVNTNNEVKIIYSSNLAVWTPNTLGSTYVPGVNELIAYMAYSNAKYWLLTQDSNQNIILSESAALSSTSWTTHVNYLSYTFRAAKLAWNDNTLCFCLAISGNVLFGYYYNTVNNSLSSLGSISNSGIGSGTVYADNNAVHFAYLSSSSCYINTAQNNSSSYTTTTISNDNYQFNGMFTIYKDGTYYTFAGKNYLYVSATFNPQEGTQYNILPDNNVYVSTKKMVIGDNNKFMISSEYQNSKYLFFTSLMLPTITFDGAYAYIKAKE